MNIEKDTVVTLHYEMFDANNQLIDKTEEPIAYLHGGYDGIFPLVEEALHGKAVGEEVDVTLSPDDAFGEQDPELVRIEPLNVFPVEVEVGMMFEADDPETGDTLVYRVTDIADGEAVVDGNHPLAGMKLRFKGKVAEIRPATTEEIARNDYVLTPGRYVGTPEIEEEGETFEEKMTRLTALLNEQFKQGAELEAQIKANLGEMGYE